VVSAWVFNRSWYQQTFIPTLLKQKASGEIDQTVAQNFIDALNDRNLMPPTLLQTPAPADQGIVDSDSSAFEEQVITTRVTEVLASLYSSISTGSLNYLIPLFFLLFILLHC
jgi:hypothetical protein